ncbi:hypothetical protein [Lysinibacillus xylanilyticus]
MKVRLTDGRIGRILEIHSK